MEILEKHEINKIIDNLKSSKIVAMPTDTIYGFSCLVDDDNAIARLFKIKNRDDSKQFIILVSKEFDLNKLISVTDNIKTFINNNTPNPLTMIVNRNLEYKLSKRFNLPTIAIRIPDDEYLQRILSKVGLLISTSCNVQGANPINDYDEIINAFPSIDAVVKDTIIASNKSSTIIDLTNDEFKIVRQGDFIVK